MSWHQLTLLMHIVVFQLRIFSKFSLRSNLKGKFYKYACLPNGVTSSPRIFTKIMKSVLSTLRKLGYNLMNYLDDIFICGDTFTECRDAVLATVNLLLKLGFSIHPEKSQLIPVQKIEYLGLLIDYVKMKI